MTVTIILSYSALAQTTTTPSDYDDRSSKTSRRILPKNQDKGFKDPFGSLQIEPGLPLESQTQTELLQLITNSYFHNRQLNSNK